MGIPGMGAFAAQAKSKIGPPGAKPAFGAKPPPPGGHPPPPGHPAAPAPGAPPAQHVDAKSAAQEAITKVQAGQVDPELAKLMRGYSPDDGYPAWATDEAKWVEAEDAIDPKGKGAHLMDPWLIVAHVYKAISGPIDPSAAAQHQEPDGDEPHAPPPGHPAAPPAPHDPGAGIGG